MSATIPALQPFHFPLAGSHLIEASAGTGKTFTIAAFYVRLVLGHGNDNAFSRPLTPPEILVVTFTDAATQELRDRIRARLAEAAAYFRVDPASVQPLPPDQDFLHDLRADYLPEQWLSCAHKLQLAAEWMDEAAVSTIHGWCNRMLREHAFDSLSLFTQNLETDQSELLSECVRDYWRNHYYPLNEEDARTILTLWQTPEKLEQAVKDLLAHVQHLPMSDAPNWQLQAWRQDKQAALSELKQPWPKWTREMKTLLDDAVSAQHVNSRKLQARWYTPWLEKLDTWASTPEQEQLDLGSGWERLTPEGMAEVWITDNPPSPKHPALKALANLKSDLAKLPKPNTGLLRHAAHWIAENFDQVQKRRSQMGFDDLLTGLQTALSNPQDDQGERLAALIRRQFPVALIDEFQDTDPIQYDIFQRVYPLNAPRKDCSLILIGDPKQAIYAFRGADIYTYLQAREALQDRSFTLDTNYRSTADMVAATNHCFEVCEQNANQPGAFRFRDDQYNPVPFFPVKAQGRAAQFQIEGQTQAALQLVVLDDGEALTKANYLTEMAALAASRIVELLNLGQLQQAGFLEEGALQPVQPNDIAVLVSNFTEANHVRQALSWRGVRSVYLSDKESVYASPQALEVYRWLLACSEPDNDSLLRAALSTPSLGLNFAELDELNRDEMVWEARVLQFKTYQRQWQTQGVLPMLRRLLFDFDVVERLQQTGVNADGISGERLLTDLLHLSELLQQASQSLEGEHALIRYLAEQRAAPAQDSDAHKVRLESDADLVKVVTIHKSKGLEYPLVFLPFICAARPAKAEDTPIVWHDDRQLQVELEANEEVVKRADEERLAEDIRKFYVALTRARYSTWMGLAPLKEEVASSITYLLGLKDVAPGAWSNYLDDFANTQSAIRVVTNPMADETKFTPRLVVQSQLPALQLHRPVKEDWRIGSYTQLAHSAQSHEAARMQEDSAKIENLQEALDENNIQTAPEKRPKGPLHHFPKGAEAGTFLHDLLEWAAQQGFTDVAADPAPLRDLIARRCHGRGWEIWVTELHAWALRLLQMPLRFPDGAVSVRLQDLSRYQAEMEFWFAAHHTDLQRLDKLVTQHTLGGRPRPPIQSSILNGLLKGFMDLVFEHDGRYYVADYKSNWLGPDESFYTREQLDEAIRAHRYDLQYVLYLVALHRHLRTRLVDYDYDRHVGGAIYWFLRGIDHESGGLHIENPPKVLIETLDALFAGRERRAA